MLPINALKEAVSPSQEDVHSSTRSSGGRKSRNSSQGRLYVSPGKRKFYNLPHDADLEVHNRSKITGHNNSSMTSHVNSNSPDISSGDDSVNGTIIHQALLAGPSREGESKSNPGETALTGFQPSTPGRETGRQTDKNQGEVEEYHNPLVEPLENLQNFNDLSQGLGSTYEQAVGDSGNNPSQLMEGYFDLAGEKRPFIRYSHPSRSQLLSMDCSHLEKGIINTDTCLKKDASQLQCALNPTRGWAAMVMASSLDLIRSHVAHSERMRVPYLQAWDDLLRTAVIIENMSPWYGCSTDQIRDLAEEAQSLFQNIYEWGMTAINTIGDEPDDDVGTDIPDTQLAYSSPSPIKSTHILTQTLGSIPCGQGTPLLASTPTRQSSIKMARNSRALESSPDNTVCPTVGSKGLEMVPDPPHPHTPIVPAFCHQCGQKSNLTKCTHCKLPLPKETTTWCGGQYSSHLYYTSVSHPDYPKLALLKDGILNSLGVNASSINITSLSGKQLITTYAGTPLDICLSRSAEYTEYVPDQKDIAKRNHDRYTFFQPTSPLDLPIPLMDKLKIDHRKINISYFQCEKWGPLFRIPTSSKLYSELKDHGADFYWADLNWKKVRKLRPTLTFFEATSKEDGKPAEQDNVTLDSHKASDLTKKRDDTKSSADGSDKPPTPISAQTEEESPPYTLVQNRRQKKKTWKQVKPVIWPSKYNAYVIWDCPQELQGPESKAQAVWDKVKANHKGIHNIQWTVMTPNGVKAIRILSARSLPAKLNTDFGDVVLDRAPYRPARCWKCQGLGHLTDDCDSHQICPRCAGFHELRECESKAAPVCSNCGDNHLSCSNNCPMYLEHLAVINPNLPDMDDSIPSPPKDGLLGSPPRNLLPITSTWGNRGETLQKPVQSPVSQLTQVFSDLKEDGKNLTPQGKKRKKKKGKKGKKKPKTVAPPEKPIQPDPSESVEGYDQFSQICPLYYIHTKVSSSDKGKIVPVFQEQVKKQASQGVTDPTQVNVSEGFAESKLQGTPATIPTAQTEDQPSLQPVVQPNLRPTVQQILQPVVRPGVQTIVQPKVHPMVEPVVQPIGQPKVQLGVGPLDQPVVQSSVPTDPSFQPVVQPVVQASILNDSREQLTSYNNWLQAQVQAQQAQHMSLLQHSLQGLRQYPQPNMAGLLPRQGAHFGLQYPSFPQIHPGFMQDPRTLLSGLGSLGTLGVY